MGDVDLKWYLRDRWDLVREVETEEARRKTFADRMRSLDVLHEFVRRHNVTPRPDDVGPVRAAWDKLRDHYDGRRQP
jgi:hypothetical protein